MTILKLYFITGVITEYKCARPMDEVKRAFQNHKNGVVFLDVEPEEKQIKAGDGKVMNIKSESVLFVIDKSLMFIDIFEVEEAAIQAIHHGIAKPEFNFGKGVKS